MNFAFGANPDAPDISVNWNGVANTLNAAQLFKNRWVDLNWISRYMNDASMDITLHVGAFEYAFSMAGNPFHHDHDADIIFCRGCNAFILNAKLFNQNIPRADIEGLRFDLDFEFDFNLPVCNIG